MAPKDFHHPFQPYDIQQQFMEAMYDCIEDGKVGIFESPTGTGKSLSLICASLTWLREYKRKAFDEALATIAIDDDDPEWMVEHARNSRRREMRQMRIDFEERLDSIREKERKVRQEHSDVGPARKKRKVSVAGGDPHSDDEYFALDDYSEDQNEVRPAAAATTQYSAATSALMGKLGMLSQTDKGRDDADGLDEPKIYFCSRTHSQLSQFVRELRRVQLPPSMPPGAEAKLDEHVHEAVKQVPLGSRKNLCINPKVIKLGDQTAINERCVELQQTKTPAEHRCPYLPSKDNEDLVLDFRDHALARIRDIEDLAEVGARLGICPYYASRTAIGAAELVTLPYPLLLQKSARDALGISLRGQVVVIDEAHNLASAVEGIYSAKISDMLVERSKSSMLIYLQRFRNRLKGANRVYVTQVVRVLDSLLSFFASLLNAPRTSGTVEASRLLAGKGVDQVNISKLIHFLTVSKLARKVEGYASHLTIKQDSADNKSPVENTADTPALTHVQAFLATLVNPSSDGRFSWSIETGRRELQYMLLDPAEHFRGIVDETRAVILAGGTMSPMDDYQERLFPYLPSLTTFSCGHLIPPSNLLVRTIATDAKGTIELSYKSRNDATAVRIGDALLKVATYVQGGLVVFLPSYGFLQQLYDCWHAHSMIARLEQIKAVFWDSRTMSAEAVFKAYTEAIYTSAKGAILLSVLGGKLSEGINFSDDLGRCVVVVGLPFPNLETPEWKARMQYLDEKAVGRGELKGKASREHAENVCMRAVNQAVGRVIRHKDDWASIVLMDSRYLQSRIRQKLPGWIKDCFPADSASKVDGVVGDVAAFFGHRTEA
ncbi:hypothetical protein BAUCODRAFT_514453 [Baudoinia panamericana UAMH 10762]|uniref:ATP-dependent DNA helicase CHL1 n=1 Tax=Baudoinia panamericana (strain UAMH 10762) TaxID=717646 RepID=M2NB25_BAUPA|nr:uncharacterized protein BAUCODRAFT_514453 [Baudoinia panamericana UAMH 10762]EMC96045.1 hypothetical protein BAUCODRAFT_514453 [Baudoinia panamericana UAMH 10762]